MTEIEVARQYVKADGKLHLSCGAIQNCFLNGGQENSVIIQILNYRTSSDTNYGGRVKMSDGAFEYSFGFFSKNIADKADKDFAGTLKEGHHPIILVTNLSVSTIIHSNGGKTPLVIEDYKILMLHAQKVGNQVKHCGDPNEHKNFESHKFDVSVDYPLAAGKNALPSPMKAPMVAVGQKPASAPVTMARAPPPVVSRTSSSGHYTPIASISPYISKFRVRGVCSAKEELRTIRMRTGTESKVFNFELTDIDGSSTIRIAAFGDMAEKFDTIVLLNQVYAISNAGVRPANKKFNSTGHDYELSLNANSEVTPCHDVGEVKLSFRINPVKLNEVVKKNGELVDILACIDKVNDVNEFQSRDGRPFVKREVAVVDDSGVSVNVVLWGDQARNFPAEVVGQALGVKGALVKEFNGGITLGLSAGSKFVLTPEVDGVMELLQWYQQDRPLATVQSISASSGSSESNLGRDLRLIGTLTALQLGKGDSVFMTVKARISNIKSDTALYQSCPSETCMKKVTLVDGEYRCEKCQTSTSNFSFRYMIQMEILDMTGAIWATVFGNVAEQMLGISAEELGELKNQNPVAYDAHFERLKFAPKQFRIRARSEVYNEEERIKYSVYAADPVNYAKLNPILDGVISKLSELTV